METTFFAMRCKEVINVCDGKSLGKISDMVFDMFSGQIYGLLVPSNVGIFNIFHACDEIFIPYQNICKIGEDVILVDLAETNILAVNKKNKGNIIDMLKKSKDNESKQKNEQINGN